MTLQLRPTFSESWYRVVGTRPKLRVTAQINRQNYRGELWYVVRDPAGNQYHRLSDAAYRFVALLDGKRTVGDAWELVGGQLADDAPTQPEVIQILSQLYAANLIQADSSPDAQVLLNRYKKQQVQKTKMRMMNVLFPRIPIWDPDKFLIRWLPVMRIPLSFIGLIVWIVLMTWAGFALLPHWDALKKAGWETINFTANPENAILLYVCFGLLKFIHEMGHAFSCRRFGGEVHELGIMLLVLFPAPYVDASSAWAFQSRWQRILVGAGGMIFELAVAAIFAFIWLATKDGSPWVAQLSYNCMLIASVSTIVFNINPLLRYDGYYMLSDYLEIPNLQRKSNEYTCGLFKRHLFTVKAREPLPPWGQKFWLLSYSLLSNFYRIFVGFAIMLLVLFQLPEQLRLIGLFMGLGTIAIFFIVPLFKLFKYLTIDPELHRKRIRAWLWIGSMAAVLVFAIGIVGWPVAVRAEGIVEAVSDGPVYVESAGFVEAILVKDGADVVKGTPLIVLRNDDLKTQYEQANKAVEGQEVRARAALRDGPGMAQIERERLADLSGQRDEIKRRLDKLILVAPVSGTVVAPNLHLAMGQYLQPGMEPLARVVEDGQLVVRGLIAPGDEQLLQAAQRNTIQMQINARLGKGTLDAAAMKQAVNFVINVSTGTTPTPGAAVAMHEPLLREIAKTAHNGFSTQIRLAGDLSTELRPSEVLLVGRTNEVPSPALTLAGGGAFTPDPKDPSGRRIVETPTAFNAWLANSDSRFVPGQRAYIRVRMDERKSLLWQGWRALLQLILTTRTS